MSDENNNTKQNPPENEKEKDKDSLFEDIQKQLKSALNGLGKNSFIIPLNAQKQNQDSSSGEENSKKSQEETLNIIKNFKFKPKEIKTYLDRFVIKQDEAKKVLSVAICDHYNHVRRCLQDKGANQLEYTKQNVLLLGPTGVGKTYLIKCLANLIGVPFVKADATKYSATGYVGNNVEDLARDLIKLANGNIELAQYGIIYIDEIDKISSSTSEDGKDVSGRGVQINLLKLMEDSEVSIISQTDMLGQLESAMSSMNGKGKNKKSSISTKNILFIVSGAFEKLSDIVKKRTSGSQIGFDKTESSRESSKSQYLKEATTGDFIKYGFEPEFIGRIPVRIACDELSSKDLEDIMTNSEGSILKQYIHDFEGYNIKFKLHSDAISFIAAKAYEQQTGARGIMTVMEGLFRLFKYELPSMNISEFTASLETVKDPEKSLAKFCELSEENQSKNKHGEINKFCEDFKRENAFTLNINKQAVNYLVEESKANGLDIYQLCLEKFRNFPFGIKLKPDILKKGSLTVNLQMVKFPEKELSKLLQSKSGKTILC